MQIETWPIGKFRPYKRNPRKNDHAVAGMATMIKEYGFRVPMLAKSSGLIIDGHLRWKAAKELGLAELPVVLADDLTEAQIKAFRVAVNKSAEWAEWDTGLLIGELQGLEKIGFDLTLTGFDLGELMAGQKTPGLTDPEVAPEPPSDPVTRPGDMWIMGGHRDLCGDSTDAASVARLLGDDLPHLMVTDPPYGVDYSPNWRNTDFKNIRPHGNARAIGEVKNDGRADWREAWALFPGDVAYAWCASLHCDTAIIALEAAGFERRSLIIWAKQHFQISRGHYHWQHETCWYVVRTGKTGHWASDRKQTTVWEIANANAFGGETEDEKTIHGTQKPVECMARPMRNNSKAGECVYDPFLGSGTSIIAATMEGRRCLGIDIDPAYVDVAVLRWQAFTGEAATLDGDGRTFAELAEERTKKRRRPKTGANRKKAA